eukprot:GFUD01039152.1.p1 GENE.GFUD01039152.1~~GFUD01039152.1.p1  ORF type:complete len:195 (+),score=49.27 GFUD01039152.1:81-665(+)
MRCLVLLLFLVVLVVVVEVNCKSGGKSGSSRGSRSRSTVVEWSKYNGGKKSSVKKKLVKAAVIGAVAYGAYQVGKATAKFASWSHTGWEFNDWNRWREADGHLCRNNNDCNWLDRNLQCEDYNLVFSYSRAWYGGDFAAIVGECECQGGMVWNDYELQCQVQQFGGLMTALIVVLVFAVLGCCCCGFFCWFCRR